MRFVICSFIKEGNEPCEPMGKCKTCPHAVPHIPLYDNDWLNEKDSGWICTDCDYCHFMRKRVKCVKW